MIESVAPQELDVRDAGGTWYSLRIRPYKNLENRIEGAVMALFNVDLARRHEVEVQAARRYAEAMADTIPDPLLILDTDLRVRGLNRAFSRAFKVADEDARGVLLHELGNGQWDIPALRTLLEQVVSRDLPMEDFRVEHEFPVIGRRVMLLNATRVARGPDEPELVLVAMRDVTGVEHLLTQRGRPPARAST